jgi:hypothetical protein
VKDIRVKCTGGKTERSATLRHGLKITHPPRFSLKFKLPRIRADRAFIRTEISSTVWAYFNHKEQAWQ